MKATAKKKVAERAVAIASDAAAKWPDARLLTGLAYESLIASFGLSHDTATHIVSHEMKKRKLSHG